MMNKWLNRSKEITIADNLKQINQLIQKVQDLELELANEKQKSEQIMNKYAQHESERHSLHVSDMVPASQSPMNHKAKSVANILSSRNLRNQSRHNAQDSNLKSKRPISEIDEDFERDPPAAYNPFKDQASANSFSQNLEISGELSQVRPSQIYERLHEDAKLKEAKLKEYESIKKEDELNQCTFAPNLSRTVSRGRSSKRRYDELAKSDKNAKEEIYKMRRETKEMEGCTFKPIINSSSSVKNMTMTSDKNIFNKLYDENVVKKKYKRNLEIDRQSKELEGCTFTPQRFSATQSLADSSFGSIFPAKQSKQVFNKLYLDHESLKRKKIKMEIDKKIEEDSKYSFIPQRMTKHKDADFGLDSIANKNMIYDKLYKDAEVQRSKLNSKQKTLKRELQELSRFSSLSFKHSGKKKVSLMYFRK